MAYLRVTDHMWMDLKSTNSAFFAIVIHWNDISSFLLWYFFLSSYTGVDFSKWLGGGEPKTWGVILLDTMAYSREHGRRNIQNIGGAGCRSTRCDSPAQGRWNSTVFFFLGGKCRMTGRGRGLCHTSTLPLPPTSCETVIAAKKTGRTGYFVSFWPFFWPERGSNVIGFELWDQIWNPLITAHILDHKIKVDQEVHFSARHRNFQTWVLMRTA